MLIQGIAKRRLEQIRRGKFAEEKAEQEDAHARKLATGLLEFIPKLNPHMVPPRHLADVAALFERAETEPVRALVSAPPRHGKTSLLLAGLARFCLRCPRRLNAYVTYSLPFAFTQSRLARDNAIAAGVVLREDAQSLGNWRTTEGGGLIATSVGGLLTGLGFDGVFVLDDPHKDRAHAESPVDRAFIQEWLRGTAFTRIEPTGSIIVFMTRWHDDDTVGYILRERIGGYDWEVINLPAIDEMDRPLWPERWPLELLRQRRAEVGEYDWASQYQGRPISKSNQLFGDVTFYDELPRDGYRVGVGVDMGYTTKKQGDWSVAVVCRRKGEITYVTDVLRMKALQPEFQAKLKAQMSNCLRGARWRSYVGTTELGITDLARDDGLPIDPVIATGDKAVRAAPVAAAWNAGNVRVPHEAPWLEDFLRELRFFPKTKHDDQVDALSAAFDVLNTGGKILKPRELVVHDHYRLTGTGRGF